MRWNVSRLPLLVVLSACCSLLTPRPVAAQVAGPGDVYFKVHVDQRFKYYVFVDDQVVWGNADLEGDELAWSGGRDTTLVYGTAGVAASVDAAAGVLSANLASHIDVQARTGIFHYLFHTLSVSVYVRGPSGTRYWLSLARSGGAEGSRLGGLPGSLQPVNGTSYAAFEDSSVTMGQSGAAAKVLADSSFRTGVTTTQISVGGQTYSLAGSYSFDAPAYTTQAVCILGCMTAPATFHALGHGTATIRVYPFASPVGVDAGGERGAALAVHASPNPLRGTAAISFRAPAGERARLEVFDLGGRRVALLHDGEVAGGTQQVDWNAGGLPGGLYFVRLRAGGRATTARVAVSR